MPDAIVRLSPLENIINVSWTDPTEFVAGGESFLVGALNKGFLVVPNSTRNDVTTLNIVTSVDNFLSLAYAKKMWVATSASGKIYKSEDLQSWSLKKTLACHDLHVAAGKPRDAEKTLFVAAGTRDDASGAVVSMSNDLGETWSDVHSITKGEISSVDFCKDAFFIGGTVANRVGARIVAPHAGILLRSTDGSAWQQFSIGTPVSFFEDPDTFYVNPYVGGVAVDPSNNNYVAIYSQPFIYAGEDDLPNFGYYAAFTKSKGGTAWDSGSVLTGYETADNSPFGGARTRTGQRAICFGNEKFLALGSRLEFDDVLKRWDPTASVIFTSETGSGWAIQDAPVQGFSRWGACNYASLPKKFFIGGTKTMGGGMQMAPIYSSTTGTGGWTSVFDEQIGIAAGGRLQCIGAGKIFRE